MDPYTSGRYAEANPDWHEADAEHKARVLADMIRYLGLEPRVVADVGCGTGGVLRHLKAALDERLVDTTWEGWDIAPTPIARARKHEGERLQFVAEDFLASERRADLLLAIDVIEHVPDDLGFLRSLLPRADWFLFRIPLDLSALDVLRPKRLVEARHRYGHRHCYTREIALDLLTTAGYRVESARYDRITPPLATSRQRAIDLGRRALFTLWPHRTVRLLGGWSLVVCCRPA
jgi:SAM-dependent methyltransferase